MCDPRRLSAQDFSVCLEPAGRPPAAVVIELSRRPSQGRDLGLAIRLRKAARRIPLVFVGGEPEDVEAGLGRAVGEAALDRLC